MNVNNTVFWDVTPCNLASYNILQEQAALIFRVAVMFKLRRTCFENDAGRMDKK
jgi:hypothetical protein